MKGIIYEIKCNETNEIYIGSTIRPINHRILSHIKNNRCVSKQIIERNNYVVNILEDMEFIDIKELRIREQFYIDTIMCINKKKAYISEEQKQLNKIKIKQYKKEYREAYKDKIKQYKDSIKDKIKEYNKQYYQNKIKSNII